MYTLLYTYPCTPSMYTPRAPPGHRRVYSTRTLATSSGRTRWFPDQAFPRENVKVRLRLDRRAALATCVCQAKSIKRQKAQLYSASVKRQLPQISSFSGPASQDLNGQALEC